MKPALLILMALGLIPFHVSGQSNNDNFRNYPIVITLQFHSLSMPFKDLKSNFSNIGIGVGTEVSHNGKHSWVQQFNLIWFNNEGTGDGIFINTKTIWRPTLVHDLYSGVQLGVGYMMALRPTKSYRQENGEWVSVRKKGKGLFAIPAGISVGYNKYSESTYVAPFIGYQVTMLKNYNKSIPLMPQSFLQVGSRVHLEY